MGALSTWGLHLAERVGFEPTKLSLNGFQDRRLRPLGHLSAQGGSIPTRALQCQATLRYTALYGVYAPFPILG